MNAPKLTPEHVAAQVASVQYHVFPGTTVTVCCITLRNGYNTIGHSACVSPENFDAAIGEQIAYKNALNEIWQLEGYLLREFIHLQTLPPVGVQVAEGGGIMPAIVPHGHTAYAAAPQRVEYAGDELENSSVSGFKLENNTFLNEREVGVLIGGHVAGGGDYAGAGASGSWEPAAASCGPAADPSPTSPGVDSSASCGDTGSGI